MPALSSDYMVRNLLGQGVYLLPLGWVTQEHLELAKQVADAHSATTAISHHHTTAPRSFWRRGPFGLSRGDGLETTNRRALRFVVAVVLTAVGAVRFVARPREFDGVLPDPPQCARLDARRDIPARPEPFDRAALARRKRLRTRDAAPARTQQARRHTPPTPRRPLCWPPAVRASQRGSFVRCGRSCRYDDALYHHALALYELDRTFFDAVDRLHIAKHDSRWAQFPPSIPEPSIPRCSPLVVRRWLRRPRLPCFFFSGVRRMSQRPHWRFAVQFWMRTWPQMEVASWTTRTRGEAGTGVPHPHHQAQRRRRRATTACLSHIRAATARALSGPPPSVLEERTQPTPGGVAIRGAWSPHTRKYSDEATLRKQEQYEWEDGREGAEPRASSIVCASLRFVAGKERR